MHQYLTFGSCLPRIFIYFNCLFVFVVFFNNSFIFFATDVNFFSVVSLAFIIFFYSFNIFCFESTCALSTFSFKSARLFFVCLLFLWVFDYSLAHEWDTNILTPKNVYHIYLLIQNHLDYPLKKHTKNLRIFLDFW